jgi:hypothetical protein
MSIAGKEFQANAMSAAIQIGAVFVIVMLCYQIIRPFIGLVAWALIIAVALYPAHLKLSALLGGREKLSATIFVLIGLAVLLVPVVNLADSSIQSLQKLSVELDKGTVSIPPPDASVADWPLIGERVHGIWANAASNLEATLNQSAPQLQAMGKWLLRFIGGDDDRAEQDQDDIRQVFHVVASLHSFKPEHILGEQVIACLGNELRQVLAGVREEHFGKSALFDHALDLPTFDGTFLRFVVDALDGQHVIANLIPEDPVAGNRLGCPALFFHQLDVLILSIGDVQV